MVKLMCKHIQFGFIQSTITTSTARQQKYISATFIYNYLCSALVHASTTILTKPFPKYSLQPISKHPQAISRNTISPCSLEETKWIILTAHIPKARPAGWITQAHKSYVQPARISQDRTTLNRKLTRAFPVLQRDWPGLEIWLGWLSLW